MGSSADSRAALRALGALLTGTEARNIADRLVSGQTLTVALQATSAARGQQVRGHLIAAGLTRDLACVALILRGIEGARASESRVAPLWSMPGHVAQHGALMASLAQLVEDARVAVTCATFNFQTSSGMWDALTGAAHRPGVAVRVYLDTAAAQVQGAWVPPSTAEVARHLRPAVVLRTKEFAGKLVRSHAKFLVVDHRVVVVTSANFSWSAENGNVEFGVRIDDPALAGRIEAEMRDAEAALYERVSPH